mmetsp:Transcript_28061/g.99791  ORF Transcript_28061/g.99791 Transcript_28061/m.99791 type:complete len:287 (-) Transcript_28061:352-1212(-)
MHHSLKREGTGVHTVEGNVAGQRAAKLTRLREADQEAYEAKKAQLAADHSKGVGSIDDKFDRTRASAATVFQQKTVGLVSAAAFRLLVEEREKLEETAAQAAATPAAGAPAAPKAKVGPSANQLRRQKIAQKASLSFGEDDGEDDEDDDVSAPLAKVLKCPHVYTAFLPDHARDAADKAARAAYQGEWDALQTRVRAEPLEVSYAFFDGAAHRRKMVCAKGHSVGEFLAEVQRQLAPEFAELRGISSDALLFVKEDVMLPHHYTFYDLIVAQARGKSGPFFQVRRR